MGKPSASKKLIARFPLIIDIRLFVVPKSNPITLILIFRLQLLNHFSQRIKCPFSVIFHNSHFWGISLQGVNAFIKKPYILFKSSEHARTQILTIVSGVREFVFIILLL